MSGFTLFETLRIFLPGALGVLVLDLALRFSFGPDPVSADGGVRAMVNTLQSPLVGVFVAVFIGLALYLLDLPAKSRLYREGDPARRIQVPSAALADSLKGTPLGEYPKYLSLYFLLSDRYLPDELHKRIYLFGSLYRVYVDMRALLAFATIGGIAAGLAAVSGRPAFVHGLGITFTSALVIGVLILSLLAVGTSAIFAYAHNVRARHGPREVWKRLRAEGKRISVCSLVLLGLGFLAVTLVSSGQTIFVFIGMVLGLGCLTLWSWIEIGPPGGPEGRTDLRSIVLTRLRATVGDPVQPVGALATCALMELLDQIPHRVAPHCGPERTTSRERTVRQRSSFVPVTTCFASPRLLYRSSGPPLRRSKWLDK